MKTKSLSKIFDVQYSIRTSHMNEGEKFHISKLCKKYSNIFQMENKLLSPLNQIKRSIKTRDENPVYTKSDRYPFVHEECMVWVNKNEKLDTLTAIDVHKSNFQ